jgi:FkbM family methyltransferase
MTPLARQLIWRLGRKLYMAARGDELNEMPTRGELRLQRLLNDVVRPDSKIIAFDIGARIGDWSASLADIASARIGGFEIHAFEPVPDSRIKLQEALASKIAAGVVRVNEIALSNESKTATIYVPHFTGGTSTLHPDSSVKYEQALRVKTSTVDRYCSENAIGYVDLIKIDTEGNDLQVIQGTTEFLRTGRVGVVQFEYNQRWIHARHYLRDVFDLIRNTPYRVAKVCPTALEVYVEWHPELERFFETNYALVHERLTVPLGCDIYRIGFGNACERVKDEPIPAAQSIPGAGI